MERSQVPDASRRRRASGAMNQLELCGMEAAHDEIIAAAVKRRREPRKIIGDPLAARISEGEGRARRRCERRPERRARSSAG